MSKKTPAAKSRARRFALQALYQVQFAEASAGQVELQFRQDHDMKRVDTEFFHDLVSGIMHARGDLEQDIEDILVQNAEGEAAAENQTDEGSEVENKPRSLDDLDPVAKAVLLIGAFELINRIEIPYKVVLNESIELAKQFGGAESHRFVNQVLDKMAKVKRKVEVDHEASRSGSLSQE